MKHCRRSVGDWTRSLKKMIISPANLDIEKSVGTRSRNNKDHHGENQEGYVGIQDITDIKDDFLDTVNILMHIEGPYGMPTVELTGGYYKVFLLIAGGIGKFMNRDMNI
jgi:hypothetical protein